MAEFIEHSFGSIERIEGTNVRLYKTPDGSMYPSVTSILSLHGGNWLEEWKARVGEDEVKAVSARAVKRGTAVHQLCEDHLRNGKANPSMFDLEMYKHLVPYLNRIDKIHALETPLYSNYLQVAGTVDCIAEFDGKLSIIDFKTAGRVKTRDEIHGYFMQTSAYAVAFEELTGIPVSRLVIIMAVDHHGVITFEEKRDDWINEFISLRQQYKLINKI